MIGKQFGAYVIERQLGRGGMGVVYAARQTDLDRLVALKVLPSDLTLDASFIKRFLREAAAVAQLNHPNIVHIYDSGQQDGNYYYVMELIAGESLDDRIQRKRRLPWKEAVRVLGQACRGLQAAHDAGIIHRDLKPGNILLNEQGQAKLMDFGIAFDMDAERLTRTGSIVGTPEYMSPEQAAARPVTAQSDIYSLGVVFYEMLTGRVPFENENRMITLQQHQRELPRPPRELVKDLPVPIERIVQRMLAKDPVQRHASCHDLIAELRSVLKVGAGGTDAPGASISAPLTLPKPGDVTPPWRTRASVATGLTTAKAGIERIGWATLETLGPLRVPLAAVAVAAIGFLGYRAYNPCARYVPAVPSTEIVNHDIMLSYMREMFDAHMNCYQEDLIANPAGRPACVVLRNGAILAGYDARVEGDAAVLSVPGVRGDVRLPLDQLAATPLYGFERKLYAQQIESWARLFHLHWKSENQVRGGLTTTGLQKMLRDARQDIRPPVEQRCKRELRQVAKQWRAVQKAAEKGKGEAEARAGYAAALRAFAAAAKPHWQN